MGNQLMEIIKFLRFEIVREGEAFEMGAWVALGGEHTGFAILAVEFIVGQLTLFIPFVNIGGHMFGIEFPDSLAEIDVGLVIVSRMETFHPSVSLTVGHFTNFSIGLNGFGGFAFHLAHKQLGAILVQLA